MLNTMRYRVATSPHRFVHEQRHNMQGYHLLTEGELFLSQDKIQTIYVGIVFTLTFYLWVGIPLYILLFGK